MPGIHFRLRVTTFISKFVKNIRVDQKIDSNFRIAKADNRQRLRRDASRSSKNLASSMSFSAEAFFINAISTLSANGGERLKKRIREKSPMVMANYKGLQ